MINMGDVALRFRIMPEKPGEPLDKLKAQILLMGAKEVRERLIGFGLKFLDVLFVVPDKGDPGIEENLRKLEGVGSVETEGVTLI